ncbi:SMC family ATPase [Paraburkholderia sp. SIMBA_009]|uniref:Exonuclease SbcC n=1 Tax=Paraburkholderia tropica TaxID=92647 RepID=A0ABX5MBP5_9BURK|nr:SMC family ATPase [Paraburkholderia tropica]PXX05072.1 exonuclease SbcC [Paraburkholderia tropica]PZW70500.1 exonuclease SbcC [Paraburkholderia tropica]QNB17291.1 SMC family ATPase [Paraburkholderia tropica]
MRPLILTLEGFHGVRDGMRRESVTLDLETLPVGLIALKGPNGAGKSTLMDNLHPYRIMPSHAAKLSVDAFSYWDHVRGPQAMKILEWDHANVRYRSTFSFRKPGKTNKAEYFLAWRDKAGLWQPFTAPDGTKSDGKADTYDRCVESVCGSLESFFTSVFSAQNRRPLASYNAGEIKSLLAELLHIDHLRALATKAADVAKVIGARLDGIQRELATLSQKRETLAATARGIAADTEAIAVARRDREDLQGKAQTLAQQRATLAAKQAESATAEARLRELEKQRGEVNASLASIASQADEIVRRLRDRRSALEKSIASHEATLSQRAQIEGAQAQCDQARIVISREEARIKALQTEIVDLAQQQTALAEANADLNRLEGQGQSKTALLKTLQQQAAVIDQVPCAGHAMHTTCPLLAQARDASSKAAEQRVSVEQLRTSYRQRKQVVDRLAPVVAALAPKRDALQQASDALTKARNELQQATALAARKPLLEASANALTEARSELASAQEQHRQVTEHRDRETKRLQTSLQDIAAEASRLAASDVTAAIAGLDRQLVASREACAALDARIEALIRQQATRETQRDAMTTELAGFDATRSRADRLSDEIAHWKLLAKGLGNDGLVALTIDDAGPALTQTVNDLLMACYGPRFTVEIRTQRALASGDMREGFEILVHDADHDSTKPVSVMSGGQKVWINECLTRGIALYLARNAGEPYESLFSDESDGPLDPARKVQFMKMKREVLRQGGYAREFFISQTPDLVLEADAVIDVEAMAA